MITLADLIDLQANPQVAYDGYDDLRANARMLTAHPIDPRMLDEYAEVFRAHSLDWCRSVLGHDVMPNPLGRGGLPWLETEMLRLAHKRGLEPPEPPWLVEWKAETAAMEARREADRRAAAARDEARWIDALATCGIRPALLEVRPNVRSSGQVRGGRRQALNHVVPLVDVRSARRRHPAGRELCAVGHVRVLGDPVDWPATCVSCLNYTAEIASWSQPADTSEPEARS